MNIAILNFSGNVGKSTLAKHLLKPRLENCEIIPIETINENEIESPAFKGKNLKDVLVELFMYENTIVDIGSSNIEQVLEQLKTITGSHEDFDYYVVPTVPDNKQQTDTLNLILELMEMGVSGKRIRVVFNLLERDDEIQDIFPSIYELCVNAKIPTATAVYKSDLFSMLEGKEIKNVIHNENDLKAEIAKAENSQEKRKIGNAMVISRMARGVQDNLDNVFEVLFK